VATNCFAENGVVGVPEMTLPLNVTPGGSAELNENASASPSASAQKVIKSR
jgi:hypothetical protein